MTEAPTINRNNVALKTKEVEVTKGKENKGRTYYTLDWDNVNEEQLAKHLGWDVIKGWIKQKYNLIAQNAMWQAIPAFGKPDEGTPDISKVVKFLEELSVTSETIEEMQDRITEIVMEEMPPVWAKLQEAIASNNMAEVTKLGAVSMSLSNEVKTLQKNIEIRKERYKDVGRKPAPEKTAEETAVAAPK